MNDPDVPPDLENQSEIQTAYNACFAGLKPSLIRSINAAADLAIIDGRWDGVGRLFNVYAHCTPAQAFQYIWLGNITDVSKATAWRDFLAGWNGNI